MSRDETPQPLVSPVNDADRGAIKREHDHTTGRFLIALRILTVAMLAHVRGDPRGTLVLQQTPFFWIARARLSRIALRGSWARSAVQHRVVEARSWTSELMYLIGAVWRPAVVTLCIVVGLDRLEGVISPAIAPVAQIQSWFFVKLNASVYSSAVGVVLQVAALFLGLYFTAVSLVTSTSYAHVPTDVRALLIQERTGRQYFQLVTMLAIAALYLQCAFIIGAQPGVLNACLLTVLTSFCIFGFVVLGTRALFFFDPVELVFSLNRDLLGLIQSMNAAAPRLSNVDQQRNRWEAGRLLATYSRLLDVITVGERATADSITRAIFGPVQLASLYSIQKARIPSSSLWFGRVYRHQDWFLSDHSRIELALQSGTTLAPEEIPDPLWFESQIDDILRKSVQTLVTRGEFSRLNDVMNWVASASATIAEHFGVEETLQMLRSVWSVIRDVKLVTPTNSEASLKDVGAQLAAIDAYGFASVNAVLGFRRSLEGIRVDQLQAALKAARWNDARSLYSVGRPAALKEWLERLQGWLSFEQDVEGQPVTAEWYRLQIASLGAAHYLVNGVNSLITHVENDFATTAETWLQEQRFVETAQLAGRGLEACAKLAIHLAEERELWEALERQRRVPDQRWPVTNWDQLDEKVRGLRGRLIVALGRCGAHLADLPRSDRLPDYFGHAYFNVADECYRALSEGDQRLFANVFPALFYMFMAAHERLSNQLGTTPEQYKLVFITEPIVDAMYLSGFAILYSAVHQKDLWLLARKRWDAYFSNHRDPGELAKFLVTITEYRDSVFALAPGAVRRTSWTQEFERRLVAAGIRSDEGGHIRRQPVNLRIPAVIRALGPGPMPYHQADDVFLVEYVAPKLPGGESDLPRRAKSFADSLRLQVERTSQASASPTTDDEDDDW